MLAFPNRPDTLLCVDIWMCRSSYPVLGEPSGLTLARPHLLVFRRR